MFCFVFKRIKNLFRVALIKRNMNFHEISFLCGELIIIASYKFIFENRYVGKSIVLYRRRSKYLASNWIFIC